MIFQEPMTSLNPVLKVGRQVRETLLVHNPTMSKAEAKQRVWKCSSVLASPKRKSAMTATRTSFPAACASA